VGQKVNPVGMRIGVIRDWESKWFADKDYATLLHEDLKVREYIMNELREDCRTSRPSFDNLFLVCFVQCFNLLHEMIVNKWSFF